MRDYSCHTVNSIIDAFEKSLNYPFKEATFGLSFALLMCQYVVQELCAFSLTANGRKDRWAHQVIKVNTRESCNMSANALCK